MDSSESESNVTACTVSETKIAPENGWLEAQVPFGMAYFQGPYQF